MKYSVKIENPQKQFIQISIELDASEVNFVELQLPSWRPGRYELGNFAKNIKGFEACDNTGNNIEFSKTSKDLWRINSQELSKVIVKYQYYAAELNAGSTWLDKTQLYINPVNCCMYDPLKMDQECFLELDIPENYKIATSLKQEKLVLKAIDFHELVDSPIICSPTIQFFKYELKGIVFHLCFQGEIKVDWPRIKNDFIQFTEYQIKQFESFPVNEYYFLFQITPYTAYHGVEHQRSTVILLGPSYSVFNKDYTKLLGISSHELYHTWNVKTIRPDDMLPYDYKVENYTQMGYVTEGVTTYMGDRILYESGVFSEKEYFSELSKILQRHFHNDGRRHYSVAESSFDTWLDGYVGGIPGRKVSIYVEGALISLICDARIRKSTDHKFTLHDVIKKMYSGDEQVTGYDENSYKQILEEISSTSFDDIFNDLVNGKKEYMDYLHEAFDVHGWKIIKKASNKLSWNFGIKGSWLNNSLKVTQIAEGSAADTSGLIPEDKIHSINGYKLNKDLDEWMNYYREDENVLSFEREGILKRLKLKKINNCQFWNFSIKN